MRILLAEDSAASRFLLQRAVEELGHECFVQSWPEPAPVDRVLGDLFDGVAVPSVAHTSSTSRGESR